MKQRLATVIILVGSTLRLIAYLQNPPLWTDEALLAYNLLLPTADVLSGTAFRQTIPVGFLLIQQLIVSLFGATELVMRAFPALASVVALPAFWHLARQLLPARGALLSLGLFALSPYPIAYAVQVKQYGVDALAAILLSLIALSALSPDLGVRRALWLGIAGFVLALLSQPAALILPAFAAGIILMRVSKERGSERVALPMIGLWAAGVIISARLSIEGLRGAGLGFMINFWEDTFLPAPTSLAAIARWSEAIHVLFRHPGGFPLPTLVLAIATLGLILAESRARLWLMISPLLPTLLLSAASLYPFSPLRNTFPEGRHHLFLLPALLLCVAAGISWLAAYRHKAARLCGAALAGLLLATTAVQGVGAIRNPHLGITAWGDRDILPVIEYLAANARDGDRLHVQDGLVPLAEYYLDRERFLSTPTYTSVDSPGSGRVWLMFGHRSPDSVLPELANHGAILDAFASGIYFVVLLDAHGQTRHSATMVEIPIPRE